MHRDHPHPGVESVRRAHVCRCHVPRDWGSMQLNMRRFLGHRGLRYLAVGAVNTGASYAVYASALLLGFSVPVASLASILFGILLSFATQGMLVFRQLSVAAFPRFVANWVIMYLAYVGVVLAAAEFGVSPYLGGLVALVVTIPLSYFVLSRFVFVPTDAGAPVTSARPSD